MTLKVNGSQSKEEAALELIKWVQELKRVRDDFEALLDEYEDKKQRYIESHQEDSSNTT